MIDWTRVCDLKDEVGADDMQEVVEIFLEESDETIARLHPRAAAPDLEADLHFLKGSALNLGFSQFAELCASGEILASQGKEGAIDLEAVKTSYASSKTAFLEGLDAHMSS